MKLPENIAQWPATRVKNALKPLSVRAVLQEVAQC